ncbi:hypothetical protein BU24DRAFT_417336 [Aaosphaeria arxii CBS 175.79]|uniref:Protein kinase domain-containing protein n=1 Tax=Aaosphaeria arxii CBS 175.79 TaxID=1450172 RepID=A0A6A5Y7Z8_9PLEO|nr:uncharacterized protein BU24DRAFT_417336 [Aaosphaeria arxii CBS 175.79]KAF2021702.1 hypothetical protein BU24DRAFT_417336 [Aaosphaeria arxii CBS 175.79]
MDVAANTIQTIGFAGQIFTGCLNGFKAWQKADDLGRDALELQIKLEWTRSRLDMWGTSWGLEQQDHLKDVRFRRFGMMALNHLVYINYCLDEFKSMDDIFPTLGDAAKYASAPAVSLARLTKSAEVSADELDALRYKLDHLQINSGHQERIKWALQDGRALKMVETVKAMVEDLYIQFPPPAGESSAVVKNSHLISDSLEILDSISGNSTADPALASLCSIKAERIRLESAKRKEDLKTHDPYKVAGQLEERTQLSANRYLGQLRQDGVSYGTPVLVEHKKVEALVNATSTLDHRVQNVARLLCMKQKPTELRTLDCAGVIVTRDKETEYRFIYQLKARRAFTLTDLLKAATRDNLNGLHRDLWALDEKFALARQLSRAVLYLHLAGWLHKGIRSNNVIFCADDETGINLTEPYLVGFEYSRADLARNETETVQSTEEIDNAFRHPDTQGLPTERLEFHRTFDIYGLGMVLLDIGSKRSVANLRVKFASINANKGGWTAVAFRKWLLDSALDSDMTGLTARMGPIYVSIIKTCLSGNFAAKYSGDLNVAFYMEVVRKLQLCVV